MPKNTLILLFSLFIYSTLSQIQTCYQLQNANQEQVWQILQMSQFDRIFILTAGTLSLLLLVSAAYTWRIYRSFSTPSDILFAIVLSEFVQNASLVIQASYFTEVNDSSTYPQGFDDQCFWMGIINIIGNVSSIYYNLIFCVLLSYSIRNTLKGAFFNQTRYHILSLIITIAVVLTLALTQSLGQGLNGICGFRVASRQSTARFVLQIVIALLCYYSMIKFRTKLPKNQYFQKQAVFGYYYYYMGIFATIQIISSLSFLISDIMCRIGSNSIIQALHIFYSISICTSTVLSYSIVFLRFSHPILLTKIIKLVKKKNKLNQSQKQILQLELQEEEQKDQEKQSWLGCLLQSLKGSQILSFIQGITVAFIQKQKKYVTGQATALSYQRNYIFEINEKIVQSYIQRRISSRESLIVKQKLSGLNSLAYQVVSYCPEAFSSIYSQSQINQVIRSLDLRKNINIVKKQSYTNGGKSGQFFFGTYDHKFLLKTIRQDQAFVYLSRMRQFTEYFKKHPSTLIVKILGIFRFKRNDINEEPIYLILMHNVTLSPKQYNLRVYDIKGSQFNRSSIEEQKLQGKDEKLRKHTLKDKDFKKLQQRVKVSKNISKDLKRVLRKDIQFLGSLGFMDYSLLIVKRNGAPSKNRGLSQITSTQQEGIIYNFGIIDYLQSWTLKRKAQRAIKTLITNKQVTANSPINYSSRLSQFIDSII